MRWGGVDLEFWTCDHGSSFPGAPSRFSRVQPRSPGRRLYLVLAPSLVGAFSEGLPGVDGAAGLG